MLKSIIKKAIDYPLSDEDITRATGLGVLTYDKLPNYNKLEDVIANEHKAVVLLYLSFWNSGHYVLLFQDDNGIFNIWDSYGIGRVDGELQYLPFYLNQGGRPHLSTLVQDYNSRGKQVKTNTFALQNDRYDTQTCGSWCIARYLMRHHSNENFARLFLENKEYIKPDSLLVLMNWFGVYNGHGFIRQEAAKVKDKPDINRMSERVLKNKQGKV